MYRNEGWYCMPDMPRNMNMRNVGCFEISKINQLLVIQGEFVLVMGSNVFCMDPILWHLLDGCVANISILCVTNGSSVHRWRGWMGKGFAVTNIFDIVLILFWSFKIFITQRFHEFSLWNVICIQIISWVISSLWKVSFLQAERLITASFAQLKWLQLGKKYGSSRNKPGHVFLSWKGG